jgi:hypothetical protein
VSLGEVAALARAHGAESASAKPRRYLRRDAVPEPGLWLRRLMHVWCPGVERRRRDQGGEGRLTRFVRAGLLPFESKHTETSVTGMLNELIAEGDELRRILDSLI